MKLLTKIGGSSGDADGAQVLEPLVHSLIAPIYLAQISWSGRAGKGKSKKVPLSKYANLLRLICEICSKADRAYNHEICINDLKYKVIKYAHSKYSSQTDENRDVLVSTSSSAHSSTPIQATTSDSEASNPNVQCNDLITS